MEEKVFSYIEKYNMIETGSQVIVGLSGGADSVCLLFLLWEYQKKVPFSVQAVHVNHQLRGSEAKRMRSTWSGCAGSCPYPAECIPMMWSGLPPRDI